MPYDAQEVFRSAASLAAIGFKIVKLYGLRDDGSCTCNRGRDCPSKGKHPAGDARWQERATDDEEEIARWFEGTNANVRWNIGVRLGPASGVIDIEADDEHAMEVIRRFGLDTVDTTAFRGSRGPHYLFQYEADLPNVGVVKVDGLEVRIGGGDAASQSVFPKSWHRTGVQYDWLPGRSPEDVPPARIPEAFKQAILEASGGRGGAGVVRQALEGIRRREPVGEGGRHAYLLGIASYMARHFTAFSEADRDFLQYTLAKYNREDCRPAKDEREVINIANAQFDWARGVRDVQRDAHPLARFGLVWNDQTREYEPGTWRMTVVYSQPVNYKLRIPRPQMEDDRQPQGSFVVNISAADWPKASVVAERILEAAPKMDVTTPNASAWANVWNGHTVREGDGRRVVQSLKSKLLTAADEEIEVSADLKRFAYTADTLLSYIRRFERANGDGEEDNLPNLSGIPKWRKMGKEGGVVKDELWLKWNATWEQIRSRNKLINEGDVKDLRARLLDAMGIKSFDSRHTYVEGTEGRWIVWTDAHIRALEGLAGI